MSVYLVGRTRDDNFGRICVAAGHLRKNRNLVSKGIQREWRRIVLGKSTSVVWQTPFCNPFYFSEFSFPLSVLRASLLTARYADRVIVRLLAGRAPFHEEQGKNKFKVLLSVPPPDHEDARLKIRPSATTLKVSVASRPHCSQGRSPMDYGITAYVYILIRYITEKACIISRPPCVTFRCHSLRGYLGICRFTHAPWGKKRIKFVFISELLVKKKHVFARVAYGGLDGLCNMLRPTHRTCSPTLHNSIYLNALHFII